MATATGFPTRMYIDGQWRDADDGRTLAVINPADESTLAEVAYGGWAEVDRAIEAAARAFPGWRAASVYDRAKVLKKTADLIRDRAETIARMLTQEQGKPLPEAKAEVFHAADTFEWFAEEGKRAYGRTIPPSNVAKRHYAIKHPVGIVGTITPWNFPAALPSRKIAPALAVGCTVVSKPAEQTSLTLILLFECLADAGLPAGVANLVIAPARTVADAFFEHPAVRKVSFTGSTAVGKELIRRSADGVKRLSLELGGHAAADRLPRRRRGAGRPGGCHRQVPQQWPGLHRPVALLHPREDRERLHRCRGRADQDIAARQRPGRGRADRPDVRGPALDKTTSLLDDARAQGAKILTGGGRSTRFEKGYFFEPTVIREVDGQMRIMTEEPFAPVMPLLDFSKLDDVIAAANNTPYGLAAYVFTNDLTVATRMAEGLEAGIIGINDPVPTTPQCPFGGMKESGLGRELGREGLDAYLETKYVSVGLRS